MFLRVNLGPMHLLKDFVNDVFVSDPKDYVRKENRISKITSPDLNKSSATATFQKIMKRNHAFQTQFGNPALPNGSKLYTVKIVKPYTTYTELKF